MKTAIITISIFVVLIMTLIYLVSVRSGFMFSITKNETEEILIEPVELTFDQAIVYTCGDGSVIAVAYKTSDSKVLELSLPTIGPIIMEQTEALKSTLFKHETGYELTFKADLIQVKKDGESIYSDCALGTMKITESATVNIDTLQETKWKWIKTAVASGTPTQPNNADDFILTFATDNRFSANTDCNNIGGVYSTGPFEVLSFTDIISTRMVCEGNTKESLFMTYLEQVSLYQIINNELILTLTSIDKSGQMTFTKQ